MIIFIFCCFVLIEVFQSHWRKDPEVPYICYQKCTMKIHQPVIQYYWRILQSWWLLPFFSRHWLMKQQIYFQWNSSVQWTCIYEDKVSKGLLQFEPLMKVRVQDVGDSLECLAECDLKIRFLWWDGYNGASAMSEWQDLMAYMCMLGWSSHLQFTSRMWLSLRLV